MVEKTARDRTPLLFPPLHQRETGAHRNLTDIPSKNPHHHRIKKLSCHIIVKPTEHKLPHCFIAAFDRLFPFHQQRCDEPPGQRREEESKWIGGKTVKPTLMP